jgi:hypothetical protein
MISYIDKGTKINVLLDNKIVGAIKKNKESLFQYFPKSSKSAGQPFKSLLEVKKSLESGE